VGKNKPETVKLFKLNHPDYDKNWRAANPDKVEAYKKVRNTRDKERRRIAREEQMEAEKKMLPNLVLSLEEKLRNKPKIAAEIEAKAAPVKVLTAEERKALEAQLLPPTKFRKPDELKPLISAPIEKDEPMYEENKMTPGREGFVPLPNVQPVSFRDLKPKDEESHTERVGTAYLTVLSGKRKRDKLVAQIKLHQDDLRQLEISLAESQKFLDELSDE